MCDSYISGGAYSISCYRLGVYHAWYQQTHTNFHPNTPYLRREWSKIETGEAKRYSVDTAYLWTKGLRYRLGPTVPPVVLFLQGHFAQYTLPGGSGKVYLPGWRSVLCGVFSILYCIRSYLKHIARTSSNGRHALAAVGDVNKDVLP